MKVIIVDDELEARDLMRSIVTTIQPDAKVIGEADSVKSGIDLISKVGTEADVVFLDVELGDGTSFDILEQVNYSNLNIVFATAYDDYAIKAFRFSAVDYILKPIDFESVSNSIDKITLRSNNDLELQMKLLLGNLKENRNKKIAIPTANGFEMYNMTDISLLTGDGAYTEIMLVSGKKIVCSYHLKKIEDLFDEANFFRIHKGSIVNLDHVKKYVKGRGGVLVLENGKEVEVARRRKEELLERLKS